MLRYTCCSDDDESNAITRKIMKTDNFTHQTGIVDVDKHMLAYIEKELKKRRGQESGEFDAEKEMQNLDPRDELFRVAEKYRIKRDHLQEGSVATSAAMLTAIPEVDLGIEWAHPIARLDVVLKSVCTVSASKTLKLQKSQSGNCWKYERRRKHREVARPASSQSTTTHHTLERDSSATRAAIRPTLTHYGPQRLKPVSRRTARMKNMKLR